MSLNQISDIAPMKCFLLALWLVRINTFLRGISMRFTMEEQWKPIKGYEGLYEISNFGRVKGLERNWSAGVMNKASRKRLEGMLKISLHKNGYCDVGLSKNEKQKHHSIHTLVWDAFGDKPRNGRKLQVDHIDNDKQNNRIDNLQLLTCRGNISKARLLTKKSNLPHCIYYSKNKQKYISMAWIKDRHIYFGTFDNIQEASEAYTNYLTQRGLSL